MRVGHGLTHKAHTIPQVAVMTDKWMQEAVEKWLQAAATIEDASQAWVEPSAGAHDDAVGYVTRIITTLLMSSK